MRPFTFVRAADVPDAIERIAFGTAPQLIAGGTNLVDLMKADVARPGLLVDVSRLPLRAIDDLPDGGLRLGALATNSATAYDARVRRRYPLVSDAILAGASPQLRNLATNGGNLLQRTRCYYFYNAGTRCNKREPGSGCEAIDGDNRQAAIFGASEQCIATHPSDLCVALAALDARVQVQGRAGARTIAFTDFHRLPGDSPHVDTTLAGDELVTSIDLPPRGFAAHSAYVKVRDRASYAFALVSVAAALELDGDTIVEARLALGGVAHKPWRVPAAEASLVGQRATAGSFAAAARLALAGARGYTHNAFKIDLGRRAIARALREAAEQRLDANR